MRKKFTMLLASLFLCVGAWAQTYQVTETNITANELQEKTEATYISIKGLSSNLNGYFTGSSMSADFSTDAVFVWEPSDAVGVFYIKNLSGNYMQNSSPKDWGTIDNAAKFYAVNAITGGTGETNFNGDTSANGYITSGTDANIVRFVKNETSTWINLGANAYNGGTGAWTIYYVYAVEVIEEDQIVSVTYQYYLDEELKKEITIEQIVGTSYAAPALDYVTFTQPDGEVNSTTTTVRVDCEQKLPFVVSASYDDATWYYMTIRSNSQKYVARSAEAPYSNSTSITLGNDGLWAFKGNVFDGIQVINKGAGDGYTLSFDAKNTGSNIYMKEGNTSWLIEEGVGGFLLRQENDYEYAHDYNSNLQFWNSSNAATDPGSAFNVFYVEDLLQDLVDAIKAKNYAEGTEVGYVESLTALNTAIENAETAIESKTNCETAFTALQEAEAALVTVQPKEGKFYTIQNAYSNVFMSENASAAMVTTAEAGIGEIFQFVSAGDNTHYLYNIERGTYLSTAQPHSWGQNSALAETTADAKNVTIACLGNGNHVSITPTGGATLHHDANYSTVVGWSGGLGSRSSWKIVEVDVANLAELPHTLIVGEAGWSTIVLGYNTAIPTAEGFKAYTIASQEDGYVKLEEATGVLGANVPVLVNATAGDYEFAYTTEAATVTASGLAGTLYNKNITAEAYVLSKVNDVVGLYKAQLTDGAFLNNANKAYYVPTNGSAAPMFSLERGEGTTSIENAPLTIDNVAIYDLTGRRVEKMEKGIYIVNGKKIIK